jgi:hypothetical protein
MTIDLNERRTASRRYLFIQPALMILLGALSGCAMNSLMPRIFQ